MKLKSLLLVAGFAAFISSQTFAVTTQATQAKLNQLQDQLTALQHQVYLLKQQNKNYRAAKRRVYVSKKTSKKSGKKCRMIKHSRFFAFNDSVVIAPYTEQTTFNTGDELIVNAPTINEDAKLLYLRYLEQHAMLPSERAAIAHPRLLLSGNIEAKAIYEDPYTGSHVSDLDLSWAEFDIFAEVSKWVNGFMAITYDNSAIAANSNRISNSNITLDRGFLLFGNFVKSHWYGSVGQVYVPFGRYGSNMISDPLTKYIGKTKARAITVGYSPTCEHNSPYGRVFVFQGASKYRNNNDINNGGADIGFIAGSGKLSTDIGVSYIYNIADSDGMQNNDVATAGFFRGFDVINSENIAHRVAGGDVHGMVKYGPFNVIGEYVSALRSFDVSNLSYNSRGAKPRALNVEGAYAFMLFAHPSSVAIGYSASRQALALNIPKQRYYTSFAMTVLNNTKATLEYRHDKNYGAGDTASGQTLNAVVNNNQLGKTDNAVTARLNVYF
ncbi:MAG: LbtU family siderophore porin [Gammaproteobacteria bacterium]|jgi:hypothetical protein